MITLGTPLSLTPQSGSAVDAGSDAGAPGPGELFASLLAGQVALHAPRGTMAAADPALAEQAPADTADATPGAADPVALFAPWDASAAATPASGATTGVQRAQAGPQEVPPGPVAPAAAHSAQTASLTPTAPPAGLAQGTGVAAQGKEPVAPRIVLPGRSAPNAGGAAHDDAASPTGVLPLVNAARVQSAAAPPPADIAGSVLDVPAPAPAAGNALGSAAQGPASVTHAGAMTVRIDTPVGRSGWDGEVATRIAFLVRERMSEAQLVLEPAELGPVQARIRFEDGNAIVALVAARADTREALEAALPRLRELLESGGLTLGDASVSHGQQEAEPRRAGAPGTRGDESGASNAGEPGATPAARLMHARGLVDLYA